MGPKRVSKPRPYWHVDAKWITGIMLLFVFSLTLVSYCLFQITAEKPAVDVLSTAMALALSKNGLDDEKDIVQFRQTLSQSPDKSIQPIPFLNIKIREQDIANLSPRETRLYLFRQIAEPLYKDGAQGLASLTNDPEIQKKMSDGVGLLGVFSLKTHQALQRVFYILGAISLVLLIPLVFFSRRFGRIASPGFIIIIASLPGAVLFNLINLSFKNSAAPKPPAQEEGMGAMASYAASTILPPLTQIVSNIYLTILLLGFGLILLSFTGKLIWWLTKKKRVSKQPSLVEVQDQAVGF